jgi:hypothetical protein
MAHQNIKIAVFILLLSIAFAQDPPPSNNTSPNNGTNSTMPANNGTNNTDPLPPNNGTNNTGPSNNTLPQTMEQTIQVLQTILFLPTMEQTPKNLQLKYNLLHLLP